MIPPIYILCNPLHESSRLQHLQRQLQKCKIPLDRVHFTWGPWGSELTHQQFFTLYDPFRGRWGFDHALSYKSASLTKGEVSLCYAMYVCLLKVQQNIGCCPEDNQILVLESDSVLREDFLDRIEQIQKELEGVSQWDYVSLGEGIGTRPPDVQPLATYFAPTKLYEPKKQWVFRCTDSMLFSRSFLQKLLLTFVPVRECLDWELNVQLAIHGGKAYWADPPLAEPGTAG